MSCWSQQPTEAVAWQRPRRWGRTSCPVPTPDAAHRDAGQTTCPSLVLSRQVAGPARSQGTHHSTRWPSGRCTRRPTSNTWRIAWRCSGPGRTSSSQSPAVAWPAYRWLWTWCCRPSRCWQLVSPAGEFANWRWHGIDPTPPIPDLTTSFRQNATLQIRVDPSRRWLRVPHSEPFLARAWERHFRRAAFPSGVMCLWLRECSLHHIARPCHV